MIRKVIRIALLACLGLVAVVAFWILPGRSAEFHLASKSPKSSQRIALHSPAFYIQTDQRWTNEKVGGTGESLGAVGCTICCLSMALAEHRIDLNPAMLNRSLKDHDGYTMRGWIKWNAIEKVTDGKVKVRIPHAPITKTLILHLRKAIQRWLSSCSVQERNIGS